jgi:hypothetical protein
MIQVLFQYLPTKAISNIPHKTGARYYGTAGIKWDVSI